MYRQTQVCSPNRWHPWPSPVAYDPIHQFPNCAHGFPGQPLLHAMASYYPMGMPPRYPALQEPCQTTGVFQDRRPWCYGDEVSRLCTPRALPPYVSCAEVDGPSYAHPGGVSCVPAAGMVDASAAGGTGTELSRSLHDTHIVVVFFVAIPGFGKSTVLEEIKTRLHAQNYDYAVVNKDALKKIYKRGKGGGKKTAQIVTLERDKNQNNIFRIKPHNDSKDFEGIRVHRIFSSDEKTWVYNIFKGKEDVTRQYSMSSLNGKAVESELQDKITNIVSHGSSHTRYVALDQNLTADNFESRIDSARNMKQQFPDNYKMTVLVCVPEDKKATDNFFSDANVKMCIKRVQDRAHHETFGSTSDLQDESACIESLVRDFNEKFNSTENFRDKLKITDAEAKTARDVIHAKCSEINNSTGLDIQVINLEKYDDMQDVTEMTKAILPAEATQSTDTNSPATIRQRTSVLDTDAPAFTPTVESSTVLPSNAQTDEIVRIDVKLHPTIDDDDTTRNFEMEVHSEHQVTNFTCSMERPWILRTIRDAVIQNCRYHNLVLSPDCTMQVYRYETVYNLFNHRPSNDSWPVRLWARRD